MKLRRASFHRVARQNGGTLVRLKLELLRRGISQRELAERAHVNETSLSRIIHGREPAYPERGRRIAVALGWTGDPEELFEEVDA